MKDGSDRDGGGGNDRGSGEGDGIGGRDDIGVGSSVIHLEDGVWKVNDTGFEVSVMDRGLMYGDGVFETVRCYDGVPAFPGRHFDRLKRAAKELDIPLDSKLGRDGFDAAIEKAVNSVGGGDVYFRLTATRGFREGLLSPTETEPTVFAVAKPLDRRLYPPASVEVVEARRPIGPESRHKTLNYLPNVRAKAETEGDEALMRDADGNIASGAVSNIFAVDGDVTVTPYSYVRRGVTREVVLDIARDLGYSVETKPLDSPNSYDGFFLTNTTWGVRPVKEFEGREIEKPNIVDQIKRRYLDQVTS
ncbi:MAG: aminotransferase class IV [Halobacteria archaeon]